MFVLFNSLLFNNSNMVALWTSEVGVTVVSLNFALKFCVV
jgi:hypothetical protein